MNRTVIFDPLVPLPVLWVLAAIAAVMLGFAIWRGLRGWPLRGLAMAALGAALLNPSLQEETRKPLTDIILAVVDDSASQGLAAGPNRRKPPWPSLPARSQRWKTPSCAWCALPMGPKMQARLP